MQDKANGVLAVLGRTATPDITTSSLAIQSDSTGDRRLSQTQFGGAFTVSDAFPLYVEGFLGGARYDPTFVFTGGNQQRRVPTRWTSLAATGGIGWDFEVAPNLVFRPIVNVSLGYVTSDINFGQVIGLLPDLKFLDDGQLFSGGLGGSVMLDYMLVRPEYEIDVELRYTHLHLQSLPMSSDDVRGSASAQTAGLWARIRWPIGDVRVFGRPLRWVAEAAHSEFLGPEGDVLGFERLSQVGGGIELDTQEEGNLITRTRLVGRYVFGDNVSGFNIGIAVSF